MTKIIQCKCVHQAQDELHGKGNRVHNKTRKASGTNVVWRCTVCLNEKAQ